MLVFFFLNEYFGVVYVSGSFFKVAVGDQTQVAMVNFQMEKKMVFDTEPTIRQHFSVGHIAKKKSLKPSKRDFSKFHSHLWADDTI